MTTETPTKATLEQAIKDAQTAYDKSVADGKKAFAEQAAATEPDMSVINIASGATLRAKNSLDAAVKALKEFEGGERFGQLTTVNRPLVQMLGRLQSAGLSAPTALTSITGDIDFADDGTFKVVLRPVFSKPDFDSAIAELKSAIEKHVQANLAAYKSVNAGDMSFTIPDVGSKENPGAVGIGRKALMKMPRARVASNGSAPANDGSVSVKNFDAVATAEEQAELDSILESEKGGNSNSKSYAYKLKVVKAHS